MELKDIKAINQRIYELDDKISRESKVIFISTLVFILTKNTDFQNVGKLTEFVNFADEKNKPVDQLINLAKNEIEKMGLVDSAKIAVLGSLDTISGANTKLNSNKTELKSFISDFISKYFVSIKPEDLFFETLYMEIDKKAGKSDDGIVLTPVFAAQLMVDLAEIDYKKDVIADLCSGTGLFSLLSYSKMLSDMNADLNSGLISQEEYKGYSKRLYNSIIANDNDPKMATLCLANFLLKSLNHSLLFSENVLDLQKSNFKVENVRIQPTKAILNPPYEDKLKPLEIVEKNIQLVKNNENSGNKVIVIIPPQKFGQKKDIFSRILNLEL